MRKFHFIEGVNNGIGITYRTVTVSENENVMCLINSNAFLLHPALSGKQAEEIMAVWKDAELKNKGVYITPLFNRKVTETTEISYNTERDHISGCLWNESGEMAGIFEATSIEALKRAFPGVIPVTTHEWYLRRVEGDKTVV